MLITNNTLNFDIYIKLIAYRMNEFTHRIIEIILYDDLILLWLAAKIAD